MLKKDNYLKNNTTYLKNNVVIKEYFIQIEKILSKKRFKNFKIADVACASGDFINFLSSKKYKLLEGYDYSRKLLKKAKEKNPKIKFNYLDLRKKNQLSKRFNCVTCLGTLTAFDDIKIPLKNLMNLTENKGFLILFDPINIYDVDTIMRYKKNNKWTSGFNLFSKNTYIKAVKKISKKSEIRFIKFKVKFELSQRKDKMRAWTVRLNSNKTIMVGTSQILNFYIILIKKNV